MTDWQDTPVFITNRNNLNRGFRHLLAWLCRYDVANITIIDNYSTYEPLLKFYQILQPRIQIVRVADNLGPYAFWHLELDKRQDSRFIVSDPDVVPVSGCPFDVIARMHWAMDEHDAAKVGPSLQIHDLPDYYDRRQAVLDWESQFWASPTDDGAAYEAQIDTTFALYRPHSEPWPRGKYLRLAPPYSFGHVPWYENSTEPNVEREHYDATARKEWRHW